jgi:hypothetical protein
MENGLLFDQAGPIGTLTPLVDRAERLDDLSHSSLSEGGDLLSACRLDRLPSGRVRAAPRGSAATPIACQSISPAYGSRPAVARSFKCRLSPRPATEAGPSPVAPGARVSPQRGRNSVRTAAPASSAAVVSK